MDISVFKNITSLLDYRPVLFEVVEMGYTSVEYEDRWILTVWITRSEHMMDVLYQILKPGAGIVSGHGSY